MKKRLPLIVSFVLFLGLAASLAYWAQYFLKPPPRPVMAPPPSAPPDIPLDAAATLFGGKLMTAVASNYQLKGVISARGGNAGVAILSADGKPNQALGVGDEVASGISVKEVHPLYVVLSEGGALKRVDLPDPKSARSEGVVYAAPPPMPTPDAQAAGRMGVQAPPLLGTNPAVPAAPGAPMEPPQQNAPPPPPGGMSQNLK